ncbi:MAG: flagellin, partial [Betaproteobacteria bacterium]
MRISSQQVFDSGVSSMQQHTSDVVKYQQQISSGRKYQLASDDALAAGLGVQIDLDNAQFAMFKVNQNHINASLTSTDSQLSGINIALTTFQQMMVQAGNGTLGTDGLKTLGQQASTLYNTVNQMSLAKDANGEQILRTAAPTTVLVAPNVTLETALSFSEVMAANGRAQDVMTFLGSVRDKLNAGTTLSSSDMDNIQLVLKQVTKAQVKTGLLQNQLDAATEAADVQKNNVELQRSNLLDTDLATATAGLVKSNALLQAAQSIMTKLDSNSLFQKL